MKKNNYLSKNLKKYQQLHQLTLAEFSAELDVPKSTLQSLIARNGNTTLDTLLRIHQAMGITLDELVYGKESCSGHMVEESFMRSLLKYEKMSETDQELFQYHLKELLRLLKHEG